jgi:ethanolamine utilization protein EutN
MRLAVIRGYVTSTVKHASFDGCRLLIAQPVDHHDQPDGAPQVVIDEHGAALHQRVLISSDGLYARSYLDDPRSPARWWVVGIVDPPATDRHAVPALSPA